MVVIIMLIMTFTNLENYVYSIKCLKQRHQSPHPSLQQSRRYFCAEKVNWLRLLFAIEYAYPADGVTKLFVYFHLKRLFPTAQDQEDYFKRADFLNNCHKSLNIYNWTRLHILVLSHCPRVVLRGSSIGTNIDICINNIDFRMVSLILLYTLCLLRSWRKETESLFCDSFFFRQGMGIP